MSLLLSPIRFPRLRPLDVRPLIQNGEPYFLLRDPLGLYEGSLLVPQFLGPVLALCDGSHTDARALAAAVVTHFGIGVSVETVGNLLAALDRALLLENERSGEAIAVMRQRYRQQPFRPPALAGLSYPAHAGTLHRYLDAFVESNGAGTRRGDDTGIVGVFSPHIDYPRGGPVYAHAWKEAEAAVQAAELVILIGTDHYGVDPFTLTRQNYATPFGILPTETAIVDELAAALGEEAAYAGELRHINEHSIELVAVWLHHMRRGRPVPFVPILCGPPHGYFDAPGSPAGAAHIRTFLETLERLAADHNALIVASGDLAHVGPAFGGAPLTATDRLQLRQTDAHLIARMCAGDADGFFEEIRRVRDCNNVCGTMPGFLTLSLMHRLHGSVMGRRLAYDHCAADEQNTSTVTVCGVVFHRET